MCFQTDPVSSERSHAKKECKASSVLNKFKEMEERAANGEDEYSEWLEFSILIQSKKATTLSIMSDLRKLLFR